MVLKTLIAELVFIVFLFQIICVGYILLTKRGSSVSTVLWLLIVLAFPFGIGIILYLFFGFNRLYTLGRAVSRAGNDFLQEEYSKTKGIKNYHLIAEKYSVPEKEQYSNKIRNQMLTNLLPGSANLTNNKLTLLADGLRAYPEMEKAISQAQSSIHLTSYIIMDDDFGEELFALLERKSQEGVKVRIIYDRLGSFYSLRGLMKCKYHNRKNDNFMIYSFSKFNIFTPWRVQLRNHRKLLVVDGKVAFTGGLNISAKNICSEKVPKVKYIHDLHCRITGSAVSRFQYIFLRDWCFSSNRDIGSLLNEKHFPLPIEVANDGHIRVVESGAGQREGGSAKVFFSAVSSAEKSLTIMTPYFAPDISFIRMLELAVARGVEVKIILPAHNDHLFMRYASSYLYENLLKQGIKIYEKQGVFSHVKAMLVDDQWVMMGSSNCDVRSFILNYELDFIVENSDFVNAIIKQFNYELTNSCEITLEDVCNKAIIIRLLENISHLFTPVL